ncbi:MAG: DUF3467 domain-containing protein [Gemmataceae bacterium]
MADEAKMPETGTPAIPTQQPMQIQIPLDVSKLQSVYCNFFRLSLSSSTEEVLMDVGMHTGIMPTQNQVEPIHLTHRVVLNPYVAKRLMESLRQIIARHEQAFGVLELDPQRRLRSGVNRPGQ